MGDIHSGPTPRGRGGSDAAFPVLASNGRSNAIDERVCLPILAVLRAIEARQLLEHVAASPSDRRCSALDPVQRDWLCDIPVSPSPHRLDDLHRSSTGVSVVIAINHAAAPVETIELGENSVCIYLHATSYRCQRRFRGSMSRRKSKYIAFEHHE